MGNETRYQVDMSHCMKVVAFLLAITGTAHARTLPQIIASKHLVVGLSTSDYPPFYWADKSGNILGFDADLAHDIGKNLGVQIEFYRAQGGYPQMADLLSSGKVDVVIAAFRVNLTRAQRMLFTEPYQSEKHVFASLRKYERSFNTTVNSNKPVGLLRKTSYIDYFKRNYPQARIVYYETMADLMKSLREERIALAYLEEYALSDWLDKHSEGHLFISQFFNPKEVDDLAMGVAPENAHFHAWLNLFIAEKRKDKRLFELDAKYLNRSRLKVQEFTR